MVRPPTDTDVPPVKPRRSALVALGWGLACAMCAGDVWLVVILISPVQVWDPERWAMYRLASANFVVALNGALGGLLGGAVVGLFNYPTPNKTPWMLSFGGAGIGIVGGALTFQTMILCHGCLSPLASSALLWCLVGFCAGVGAHGLSLWLPDPAKHPNGDEEHVVHGSIKSRSGWVTLRLVPAIGLFVVTFLVLILSTAQYLD